LRALSACRLSTVVILMPGASTQLVPMVNNSGNQQM